MMVVAGSGPVLISDIPEKQLEYDSQSTLGAQRLEPYHLPSYSLEWQLATRTASL
jgi:hypothetical protein